MSDNRIRTIAIVGGGAAGWLSAAVLARVLKPSHCEIRLIDAPLAEIEQPTEITNPAFHRLRNLLGIDEGDFMRRTQATFSLGQEFSDWGQVGDRYFHTFGTFGARLEGVPFHQYWLKFRDSGAGASIEEFSAATQLAKGGRFVPPVSDHGSVLSLYSYAYHVPSRMLATYLSEYAQARGVQRLAGAVAEVKLRGEDGFIDALVLDDGKRVAADLYLDCTGPNARLARRALDVGFEDWSHWLPCDRAVAISCAGPENPPPYSQAIASSTGWGWRIPLLATLECGQAYCSRFLDDDSATALALATLPTPRLDEPRVLRFTAGRPEQFWSRNCVWIPVGMLEPLEPLRWHLVQTSITRLLTTFPDRRFNPSDAEEYNRLTIAEHERIRDFLILHYWATARSDSPFWEYCRAMEVPETLRHKVELFRSSGRMSFIDDEHFGEESWLSVLLGQGVLPETHDPLVDVANIEEVKSFFLRMRSMIHDAAEKAPTHRTFLDASRIAERGRYD